MQKSKAQGRERRKLHIRKTVWGSSERPRLNIYKSLKHIYAQIIDDSQGKVIATLSTLSTALREEVKGGKKRDRAKIVGQRLARICLDRGVSKVVFDRSGFRYHGRVKALADGAREGGLKF